MNRLRPLNVALLIMLIAGCVYKGTYIAIVLRGNGSEVTRHTDDVVFWNPRRCRLFRMSSWQAQLLRPLILIDGARKADVDIPYRPGRYNTVLDRLADAID